MGLHEEYKVRGSRQRCHFSSAFKTEEDHLWLGLQGVSLEAIALVELVVEEVLRVISCVNCVSKENRRGLCYCTLFVS